MSCTDQAQRAAEIVKDALEREAAERQSFIETACAGDHALSAEVNSLLSFHSEAETFIDRPAVELAAEMLAETSSLRPGDLIDQYRVESLIGTGGMGEVYLATDTELKRQVALKLVQRGLNTIEMLRRFRHEEEILAGLNHPNIAQLYGSGTTMEGTPFFAMEYVEGMRLDNYCHQHALSIPERLQLFRKICSAVGYAHQRLVIHRDLKPANIRVTNEGEPKLLDFGIAKLLDANARAPDATMTLPGIMTPEYASPEQIRGETMTTASDIYSLGILLYELLTGQKPYRLTSRRPDAVARAITEQAPERPSTAVARADKSKLEMRKSKVLRGDLDNIVLMAMRKEPERRYASVALLADDIRRHLEGRTVLARKDTLGYRASKFIQRNKAGVAATALVFLSLAAGIIVAAYEARRAQRRFDEVRRLANSLMFEIHDSVQNLQGSTPTRRLIVDRALQYLDSLNAEGGADTSLQRELATAYEKVGDIQGNPYGANLGDSEGALASYRKATTIREAVAKTERSTQSRSELGRSYRGLGDVMEQKGDVAECLKNYRHSLSIFEQLAADAPNDTTVLDELARAYDTLGDGLGRTPEALERLRIYRQALALRQRLSDENPGSQKWQRSLAVSRMKVAGVPGVPVEEAVDQMRRAIEMFEAIAAADPQNARARREIGFAHYQLGRILNDAGQHSEALQNRQRSLEIRQAVAAQDPKNQQARFDLATVFGDLAESYNNLRLPNEAIEHGRKSLELFSELIAADANNAVYRRNLGLCYERLGVAHALAGSSEEASADARGAHLAAARDWYRKGQEVFADLRNRGALMPTDAQNVDKYAAKAAEAQQALDVLRR